MNNTEYYMPGGGLMPNLGAGTDATTAALTFERITSSPWYTVWRIASVTSAAACAYHGYKRNNGSIGWALLWGFLGGAFVPFTPAIAFAQGFGKPAVRSNRRRSRRGRR